MTELTEAELELMARIGGGRRLKRGGYSQETLNSLADRGLVDCGPFDGPNPEYYLTDAGRKAYVDGAVAEQFADLDRIVNVDGPGSKMAFVYLERIVRDQARRIAELEARE